MASNPKRVRAIIFDDSGRLLLGFNGEDYHLPGGLINEGESSETALYREVSEETGLRDFDYDEFLFDYFDNQVYLLTVKNSPVLPDASEDPDKEFIRVQWCDLGALPLELNEISEDIIYL